MEINEVSSLFFNDLNPDEEAIEFVKQDGVVDTIKAFKAIIETQDELTIDSVKAAIKQAGIDSEAKGKLLFMPIRIATTGQMHGPELPNSLEILQTKKVIANIDTILNLI
jgi:nondiscriminating glutamyl-tRNA synthetase